jgi:hypothetical protein
MNWIEQESRSNTLSVADQERARLLDMVKKETLPTIKREEEEGAPEFQPLDFTHIKSPGIFEGEFGAKNKDLLFHFWPYGHSQAHREGKRPPNFKPAFKPALKAAMCEVFEANRIEIEEDKDVGAIFVKAKGWGDHQYVRELSIKACEALHKAMGGTDG